MDFDLNTTYSVYALVDGVCYDDYSTADYEEAMQEWEKLFKSYASDAKAGKLGGDATIHLYDTWEGRMIAESHIPQFAS